MSRPVRGLHRLGVSELKYDWTARPDPERLLLALRQHQEVHVVGMVHHETTTGLLNPVHEIAEIVDNQNRVFVLDAVSALAGETLLVTYMLLLVNRSRKCSISSGMSSRRSRSGGTVRWMTFRR